MDVVTGVGVLTRVRGVIEFGVLTRVGVVAGLGVVARLGVVTEAGVVPRVGVVVKVLSDSTAYRILRISEHFTRYAHRILWYVTLFPSTALSVTLSHS